MKLYFSPARCSLSPPIALLDGLAFDLVGIARRQHRQSVRNALTATA